MATKPSRWTANRRHMRAELIEGHGLTPAVAAAWLRTADTGGIVDLGHGQVLRANTVAGEPPFVILGELTVATDDQIRELMHSSREVKNYLLAGYCRRALAGETLARNTVERVMAGTYGEGDNR